VSEFLSEDIVPDAFQEMYVGPRYIYVQLLYIQRPHFCNQPLSKSTILAKWLYALHCHFFLPVNTPLSKQSTLLKVVKLRGHSCAGHDVFHSTSYFSYSHWLCNTSPSEIRMSKGFFQPDALGRSNKCKHGANHDTPIVLQLSTIDRAGTFHRTIPRTFKDRARYKNMVGVRI
jgi:hypothetical protein